MASCDVLLLQSLSQKFLQDKYDGPRARQQKTLGDPAHKQLSKCTALNTIR